MACDKWLLSSCKYQIWKTNNVVGVENEHRHTIIWPTSESFRIDYFVQSIIWIRLVSFGFCFAQANESKFYLRKSFWKYNRLLPAPFNQIVFILSEGFCRYRSNAPTVKLSTTSVLLHGCDSASITIKCSDNILLRLLLLFSYYWLGWIAHSTRVYACVCVHVRESMRVFLCGQTHTGSQDS